MTMLSSTFIFVPVIQGFNIRLL